MTVSCGFEGDLYVKEYQRNRTDASFKTNGTPLALLWPKQSRAGQTLRQQVTLSTVGGTAAAIGAPERASPQSAPVRLTLGEPLDRQLPALGLGMASHGQALSAREIERLRALRPDRRRVDLRPL